MNCIYSQYVVKDKDIDNIKNHLLNNSFHQVNIGSASFHDINDAIIYMKQCLTNNFIAWVAIYE